jgi:periplasmic glucans biosynthesis protein
MDWARRAGLAPAGQPGGAAAQRLHRRQSARLRPAAAQARLRRLPGPRGALREPPLAGVEPAGRWGEGAIHLVEIPSRQEIHDNIVAFWRPAKPLKAKQEYRFDYRLHWCWSPPRKAGLARVASSRAGAGYDADSRLFVVDFVGDNLKALPKGTDLKAEVGASKGKIQHVVAQPNPVTGGWRVSFELVPGGEKLVEMHLHLMADKPVAESWLYRWQA